MNAKKGKDIATNMILDDLLEDEETSDSPQKQKRSKDLDGPEGMMPSGSGIELDADSSPFSLEDDDDEISVAKPPAGKKAAPQPEQRPNEPKKGLGIRSFFDAKLKGSQDETLRANPKAKAPVTSSVPQNTATTKGGDATLKLSESKILPQNDNPQTGVNATGSSTFVLPERPEEGKKATAGLAAAADNIRQSVGRFAHGRSGGVLGPAEASLAQSENLRIAQQRILELEKMIERLRGENERLVTAGEMIRKKADELITKTESMEGKYNLDVSSLTEEKDHLRKSLAAKDEEIGKLKTQVEEMEMRLGTTMQKIRVRERELENRLELVKMESAALVRNKDEIILELKRQIDQAMVELDNYRHKGVELNKQLNDKQDMLKRTVKALRIALTMLEGADDNVKKAK